MKTDFSGSGEAVRSTGSENPASAYCRVAPSELRVALNPAPAAALNPGPEGEAGVDASCAPGARFPR